VVRPESIAEKMLRSPLRDYIIKHKAVLEKVLIWYAKGLPEMVRESPDENNTRAIYTVANDFFSHLQNDSKKPVLEAIFKIIISEYKHDPNWQQWADYCIGKLIDNGWQRLPEGQPSDFWRT
jgi:hypothetical protein